MLKVQFSFFLLIALVWTDTHAFLWTSHLPDAVTKYVCSGQHLFLPWTFSLDHGQAMSVIEWYFDGQSREMIGMTNQLGGFDAMATFSNRVQFTPSAGIIVKNVGPSDSGTYTVKVISQSGVNSFGQQSLTAIVVVAEPPASDNDVLTATQERIAVYDNQTADWAIQLTCGHFGAVGTPPVDVVWTKPNGDTAPSSGHKGGNYLLTLDNPVKGGPYTCSVVPSSPAAACLSGSPGLLQQADVTVDEITARLTLIEARQGDLKAENDDLTSHIQDLEATNTNLSSYIHDLEATNTHLTSQIGNLQAANASFTSQIHNLQATNANFTSQIHHIHGCESDLTSHIQSLETAQTNLTSNLQATDLRLTPEIQVVQTNMMSYVNSLVASDDNLTAYVNSLHDGNDVNLTSLIQDLAGSYANLRERLQSLLKGPCAEGNHTVLDDAWRDKDLVETFVELLHSDRQLPPGWYRFMLNGQNAVMPTACVPPNRCGSNNPLWLDLEGRSMPELGQEIQGKAIKVLGTHNCNFGHFTASIRNCGAFFVYKLLSDVNDHIGYHATFCATLSN